MAAAGGPAAVDYSLIPRFFRVRTGLFPDQIPTTGYVKVLFQATGTGADGLPDETAPVVDYYSARPTFRSIDGNQPPDVVAQEVEAALVDTSRSATL